MHEVQDKRGTCLLGSWAAMSFEIKRYFLVYEVPDIETRGEHAHRRCHQFLIAVKDRCTSWPMMGAGAKRSCSIGPAWDCTFHR